MNTVPLDLTPSEIATIYNALCQEAERIEDCYDVKWSAEARLADKLLKRYHETKRGAR